MVTIPKVIHYCWFGHNPLPQSAVECIESWKKFLPDYEIKEWNENNFDINIIPYTQEAYKLKKYAFVSDYARFWILYHYGGLYFDTDVELLKPIDDILEKGGFMGMEKMIGSVHGDQLAIAPGLGLAIMPGHKIYKDILDFYTYKHFVTWNGKMTGTVVRFTTDYFQSKYKINKNEINSCDGILIYPDEYFDPMNYYTQEINITSNTRSIHKYSASWSSKKMPLKAKIIFKFKCLMIRLVTFFKR